MDSLNRRLKQAEKEQHALARKVITVDDPHPTQNRVVGIDVSYSETIAFGCAIVWDIEKKTMVERFTNRQAIEVPYIPGYFQLREAPMILDLLDQVDETYPVLIDGNGILHPRRCGIASYVGLKRNRQTIGVAKSLLLGKIGERDGDRAPIIDDDELLGMALWLNDKKPVFVSVGNRISLLTALEIVKSTRGTTQSEPLRLAHNIATKSKFDSAE